MGRRDTNLRAVRGGLERCGAARCGLYPERTMAVQRAHTAAPLTASPAADYLGAPAPSATVTGAVSLSSIPPELLVAVCVAALLLAVVQTARLAFTRWLPRHRIAVARAAGADGELRAEPLLRAQGYAVVARQAPLSYEVAVDGEPFEIALRADFLLERDGRRYVAEVKTGRLAPRLETSATRRQLLEYRLAFDVDGVLLVDVDAGRVHSLEFPPHSPGGSDEPRLGWLLWLALGGALGLGASALRPLTPPVPGLARGAEPTRVVASP